jgi:hypothetical protein
VRSATKNKTGKDKAYADWIRSLPCFCCYVAGWLKWLRGEWSIEMVIPYRWESQTQQTRTEHAHVGDDKGMSVKCDDTESLPLCGWHHREGPESHHRNPRGKFFRLWGFDRDEAVKKLKEAYERQTA